MKVLLLLGFVATAFALDCGVKPPQDPWKGDEAAINIISGRNASVGSWPWQVSLQYQREDGTWAHTCGSVLITEEWVLSAAHCLHNRGGPENFRIVAGANNIKQLTGNEQILSIAEIINHEGFIMLPPYPNDIALIRLADQADLSDENVDVACLPERDADFANDAAECWISGWGLTDWLGDDIPEILQEAYIVSPTNEECANMGYDVLLLDSHICAGTGNPNACRGDSGGPMSCNKDGTWYVAGVTSFGPVFCALLPGVYTRISFYLDWIELQMAN